jgi:serine/threonine protein kinase
VSKRENILKEARIWANANESPYIVQYKASWTENVNDSQQMAKGTGHAKSTSQSKSVCESDESQVSGPFLYIQMELCQMTLRDTIDKINNELDQKIGEPITPIGAFIASQLLHEIMNGIKYLHTLKTPIIHYDLKPENIFLTDGRGGNFIKIGDFGLCVRDVYSNDNINNQKRGTAGYMESGKSDGRCDIYSLGCIAMDLFCIDKNEYQYVSICINV